MSVYTCACVHASVRVVNGSVRVHVSVLAFYVYCACIYGA